MKRVRYLDGIRGIACLMVVLDHFLYSFYPATLLGDSNKIHNSFELLMAKTPMNFFYNGNFAVCVFFVLSGMVLSAPFLGCKDCSTSLGSATVRRYPRLVIPMITSSLFAFFLMKLGLMFNSPAAQISQSDFLGGFYLFQGSLVQVFKESMYSIFFLGANPNYNPVLWTMKIELIGSLLVFTILALTGSIKRRAFMYIVLFLLFYKTYYISFIFGLMLSELIYKDSPILIYLRKRRYLKILIGSLGVFLGSYPIVGLPGFPGSEIYDFLKIVSFDDNGYVFFHNVGALLVLLAIVTSSQIQKIFSNSLFYFIGKLSFPIYLLHLPVLCSFSSYMFLKISPYLKYRVAFSFTLIISLIIIMFLSWLMEKFVDRPSIRFSKFFSNVLLTKKPSTNRVNGIG